MPPGARDDTPRQSSDGLRSGAAACASAARIPAVRESRRQFWEGWMIRLVQPYTAHYATRGFPAPYLSARAMNRGLVIGRVRVISERRLTLASQSTSYWAILPRTTIS